MTEKGAGTVSYLELAASITNISEDFNQIDCLLVTANSNTRDVDARDRNSDFAEKFEHSDREGPEKSETTSLELVDTVVQVVSKIINPTGNTLLEDDDLQTFTLIEDDVGTSKFAIPQSSHHTTSTVTKSAVLLKILDPSSRCNMHLILSNNDKLLVTTRSVNQSTVNPPSRVDTTLILNVKQISSLACTKLHLLLHSHHIAGTVIYVELDATTIWRFKQDMKTGFDLDANTIWRLQQCVKTGYNTIAETATEKSQHAFNNNTIHILLSPLNDNLDDPPV